MEELVGAFLMLSRKKDYGATSRLSALGIAKVFLDANVERVEIVRNFLE